MKLKKINKYKIKYFLKKHDILYILYYFIIFIFISMFFFAKWKKKLINLYIKNDWS